MDTDREAHASLGEMVEEGVSGATTVAADEQPGHDRRLEQLGERLLEEIDVVLGRVEAGVARAQAAGVSQDSARGAWARASRTCLSRPVERRDHPPAGGVQGDRAKQGRLIVHDAAVGQAVATVPERQRQVAHHPAGIAARAALTEVGKRLRESGGETEPVGQQLPPARRRRALAVRLGFIWPGTRNALSDNDSLGTVRG